MPSDATTTEQQRKLPLPRPSNATHAPPPHTEALPCPRCDSTNTKFCYYNNYNLSQPRHFCKACRRYWTQGGTLRNVPVGGGSRKNSSKRHRPSSTATITSTVSSTSSDSVQDHILPPSDAKVSEASVGSVNSVTGLNSNSGVFMNLLSSQAANSSNGFLALGGFGSGYRFGFDELGLGFGGKGAWAFPEVGFVDNGGGYGGGGNGGDNTMAVGSGGGSSTWQLGSGESGVGGLADGDGLAWPELAISMPGKGLK